MEKDLLEKIQEEERIYNTNPKPKVLNIYETIDKIIDTKCSVSRVGDGEFVILLMRDNIGFQNKNEKLSKRLKEVLETRYDNLLICIPDIFDRKEYENRTKENVEWWKEYFIKYRKDWYENIDFNYTYGASNFTRYYMSLKNKENSKEYFEKVKKIWKDRDVLIVEGEQTRWGIKNDLLEETKSVQRILCPPKNAFERYDEILSETIKRADKSQLILIALGPTATVLSCDLAKRGYQAIDIGHFDIEYEWFLRQAKERINIGYKYVNECKDNTFEEVFVDEKYEKEIIYKI